MISGYEIHPCVFFTALDGDWGKWHEKLPSLPADFSCWLPWRCPHQAHRLPPGEQQDMITMATSTHSAHIDYVRDWNIWPTGKSDVHTGASKWSLNQSRGDGALFWFNSGGSWSSIGCLWVYVPQPTFRQMHWWCFLPLFCFDSWFAVSANWEALETHWQDQELCMSKCYRQFSSVFDQRFWTTQF